MVAAAVASSPSPALPSIPAFPTPRKHENNAHPYAIKTTSTALLSRSNSTASAHGRHYYVPISPSPSSSSSSSASSSRSSLGHRPSKSLESHGAAGRPLPTPPRPLPAPPGALVRQRTGAESPSPSPARSVSPAKSEPFPSLFEDTWATTPTPPRRIQRADTLPAVLADHDGADAAVAAVVEMADVPADPKRWTPTQLAAYLTNALRVRSGAQRPLALPLARDVAAFVRDARIGGRAFLRLNEADLEEMGINTLWRTALLSAARTLRANAIKGRIWGFGSDSPADLDADASPTDPAGSFSPDADADTDAFFSAQYHSSSSSSSVDLALSPGAGAADGDPAALSRRVRVRRRANTNGRVRGMVESLERRGSESSGSSVGGSGSERGSPLLADEALLQSPAADFDLREPSFEPAPAAGLARETAEPTIEELLLMGDGDGGAEFETHTGRWGARAWEEMDGAPGATAKRVVEEPVPAQVASQVETRVGPGLPLINGSGSRGTGHAHGGSGSSRRFVSAVFSPEVDARAVFAEPEDVAGPPVHADAAELADADADAAALDIAVPVSDSDSVPAIGAAPVLAVAAGATAADSDSPAERTRTHVLETELRALRARLAVVECALAGLEARAGAHTAEIAAERDKIVALEEERAHGRGVVEGLLARMRVMEERERAREAEAEAARAKERERERARANGVGGARLGFPDMAGLPSYVLLVGLGVCVVAVQVVVRRVAGRRLR